MKYIKDKITAIAVFISVLLALAGCGANCSYEEYSVDRNGVDIHLDVTKCKEAENEKSILLVHGLTYSSHEFDIDYEDYSLVRYLAGKGYDVWRIDISGYGKSEEVEDGFIPDSTYAAGDIKCAVDKILEVEDVEKIDILGWSWGTVTSGIYAVEYPENINKLVLYAPILSGLGEEDIKEEFHHNTWEHAVSDFQTNEDGSINYDITEKSVVEAYASSCWENDGEYSPNGGRRDLCVSKNKTLIALDEIDVPTLIICGDNDPYLDMEKVRNSMESLNDESKLVIVSGASHCLYIEKPYYHEFQKSVSDFLN